ncbi:hypothetical protein RHMOL_Rhmol12G0068100 [Rhododendron molle]|uniref:Uncharacterized protein n=2 Tax=Rhododendron molle TaxID=49168 RepID=A0ACC0LG21_RHOML|nr:hypothetical protein RHMOL_Rhmol12G0068100 [Rhododendron molle]KAI8527344.1 hypothetical protein RHMOL_Rhmol12G0068100 [Rhododendron molle]
MAFQGKKKLLVYNSMLTGFHLIGELQSFCVRGFSHGRGVQSRDFSCGAKSELKRSAVADNESGKIKLSDVRTSSGMFIAKGKVCASSTVL